MLLFQSAGSLLNCSILGERSTSAKKSSAEVSWNDSESPAGLEPKQQTHRVRFGTLSIRSYDQHAQPTTNKPNRSEHP